MANTGPKGETDALNGMLTGTYYVSLHTAAPGTTGANEMTGVTRQATTFNASAAGSGNPVTNATALTWTTPNTTPATHYGYWTAVSGGTWVTGGALGSSVQAATITAAAGALSNSAS